MARIGLLFVTVTNWQPAGNGGVRMQSNYGDVSSWKSCTKMLNDFIMIFILDP